MKVAPDVDAPIEFNPKTFIPLKSNVEPLANFNVLPIDKLPVILESELIVTLPFNDKSPFNERLLFE